MSGIGLSQVSRKVIYLIYDFVFISCIMQRGGAPALSEDGVEKVRSDG